MRSNTTPDCLQFCRPCVAKPASLFHTDFTLYHVSATLTFFAYIFYSSMPIDIVVEIYLYIYKFIVVFIIIVSAFITGRSIFSQFLSLSCEMWQIIISVCVMFLDSHQMWILYWPLSKPAGFRRRVILQLHTLTNLYFCLWLYTF